MSTKKQRHLTKKKQDERLEWFYTELEIETYKTVVLGEFTGDNKDVDFIVRKETYQKMKKTRSLRLTMVQMKTLQLPTIPTTPTKNPQRKIF